MTWGPEIMNHKGMERPGGGMSLGVHGHSLTTFGEIKPCVPHKSDWIWISRAIVPPLRGLREREVEMSKFGWSYPPGCSGPPDDDVSVSEEEIQVRELLENALVDEEIIDQVEKIVGGVVEKYLWERDKECPRCLERVAEEETTHAKE